jgi:hypothetical protein
MLNVPEEVVLIWIQCYNSQLASTGALQVMFMLNTP